MLEAHASEWGTRADDYGLMSRWSLENANRDRFGPELDDRVLDLIHTKDDVLRVVLIRGDLGIFSEARFWWYQRRYLQSKKYFECFKRNAEKGTERNFFQAPQY